MGPGISIFTSFQMIENFRWISKVALGSLEGTNGGSLVIPSKSHPVSFVSDPGPLAASLWLFHREAPQPGTSPVQNAQSLSRPIHRMGRKGRKQPTVTPISRGRWMVIMGAGRMFPETSKHCGQ